MNAISPAIDPTALALLSIFGGAALTIVAGFVGAGIQSRREHNKWLREQRYAAYLEYLKIKDKYDREERRIASVRRAFDDAANGAPPGFASDEAILVAMQELADIGEGPGEVRQRIHSQQARFNALYAELNESIAAFSLLGPRPVIEAARALTLGEPAHRGRLIDDLEAAMRDALSISF